MTRREQLEQVAIDINMRVQSRLLDRLVAVGEWADENPDFCIDKPVTDFKIWITKRIDIPGPNNWMVHVSDQEGKWSFDGMGAFKDCLGFAEMGMQSVNEAVRKDKK